MSKTALKTLDKHHKKVQNKLHKQFRKIRKNKRLIWEIK